MKNTNKFSKFEKRILNVQWKPVVINGTTTEYAISEDGFIYNIKTNRLLSAGLDRDGYNVIKLLYNNKRITRSIHRIVALAFIPNPDPTTKIQVNHIDTIKTNNHYSNLEWVTPKENIDHSIKMGLNGKKGELNPTSVYTETQINQVCKLMMNINNTPRHISNITGVPTVTIHALRRGDIWTHITDEYDFPDVDFITGENNINSVNTEVQIHQVCKLLEEGKLSIAEITKKTGVKKSTIYSIKSRFSWVNISKNYNIPHPVDNQLGINSPNNIYTETQIHQVCKLLQDNKISILNIVNQTGVSKSVIDKIRGGKIWLHIAKQYRILPGASGKPKNERTKVIEEMLSRNCTMDEMINKLKADFEIPDRRKAQIVIYAIKSRYNISCSTTIENAKSVE